MRQKKLRIATIMLLLAMIFGLFLTAYAATPETYETQASLYYASTEVTCIATGNGKVTVEVDINATHTMTKRGPLKIEIWEKQSDGSYQLVKTYSGGMLTSNSMFAFATKTYQGTAGTKYYAIAKLYAKDDNGSQTMYQSSSTITA